MNKVLDQVIEDYKVLYEMEKEKKQDLQQRIDKAIEYIQDNSAFMNDDEWEVFNKKDLFNILQGENK